MMLCQCVFCLHVCNCFKTINNEIEPLMCLDLFWCDRCILILSMFVLVKLTGVPKSFQPFCSKTFEIRMLTFLLNPRLLLLHFRIQFVGHLCPLAFNPSSTCSSWILSYSIQIDSMRLSAIQFDINLDSRCLVFDSTFDILNLLCLGPWWPRLGCQWCQSASWTFGAEPFARLA